MTLTKDGIVITPTKSVNLKVAMAPGTFGIGTEWRSLNALSHKSAPNEIVLSEKKGMFGTMIPLDAIKFVPSLEDIDITHSLLAWMVVPENNL